MELEVKAVRANSREEGLDWRRKISMIPFSDNGRPIAAPRADPETQIFRFSLTGNLLK